MEAMEPVTLTRYPIERDRAARQPGVRVAEGDVDTIHRWRQPKAVDRCWVCVGVGGQRVIHCFGHTPHTPLFFLLLYNPWSPVTLVMLFLLPTVSEGREGLTEGACYDFN